MVVGLFAIPKSRSRFYHFPPQTRDHLNPTSGLANLCNNIGMLNYRGWGSMGCAYYRGWGSMGCEGGGPWEVLNNRGWGSMGSAEQQRVGVHERC